MEHSNPTLIDRLSTIVEDIHLDEVKSIIASLTKINTFKQNIEVDLSEETLHKSISDEFKNEFDIDSFKITINDNGYEKVIYEKGQPENLRCIFKYEVSTDTIITINFPCGKLNNYQKLTLNTYFKELVHLLYMQFVLTNLKKTTNLDPLTKLSNRHSFTQDMKTLIPLAQREEMNLGLLLINIDRFRAVNDEHGDQFGDEFLKLYAETIKSIVRSSDFVVRFGGGEFLVLLINIDTEERTLEIANKIKDKLAESFLLSPNGDQFKKTVCIGISVFPEDGDNINTIIKNADIALTTAKDSGRNLVKRFENITSDSIELF